MSRTFPTRAILAAMVLVLLTAALPSRAAAHLYLVSSAPEDGARLDAVPRELRLRFSEPVELALTRLELLGPDGSRVRLAEPSVQPGERNVLVVAIEGTLAAGPYTLAWRTTAADGHPVSGRVGFEVDEDAEGLEPPVVAEDPAPAAPVHHDPALFPEADGFNAGSPGYVVVRWLTFVGLLGVIGAVAFTMLVLGLVRRWSAADALPLLGPATRRSATLGLAFAGLLLIAVVGRLYAQALALHGADEALDRAAVSAMLSRTTWGTGWILQAAATVVALLGFAIARRRAPTESVGGAETYGLAGVTTASEAAASGAAEARHGGGIARRGAAAGVAEHRAAAQRSASDGDAGSGLDAGWLLAAVAVLVLAFTPALGGHAVATPERAWLAVLADGLHVLGAGGWLGSLLAVVTVGIPAALALGAERRGRAVAALVNAFSPTALFFAAIVVATGVLSATFHLGSVADLWQSEYGRTLLVKVGIVLAVVVTGAYNWRRVRPRLGDDRGTHRLRRSAGVELAVAGVVLLVTAVLVATPPPLDRPDADGHTAVEAAR